MCGISGIYNFSDAKPIDRSVLKRMTDDLIHRGPNDEGYFIENHIGLGSRRLSIIDLAGGHQPIFNEDESCVIVFNGEIYNYQELMPFLISRGHQFRTRSDTEVILHLYEEEGENCLTRLRGMFAFAIWDRKKQQLFVARDRLGIKPLYYYIKDGRCLFASEIKSILEDASVEKDIDLEALSDYLSFIYIPAPKTIFKNIKKLPAGHYLIVGPETARITPYWDVCFDAIRQEPEETLLEELYHLLNEAVRMRLVSEVPLGAFLSGGIDSSSVVALMSQLMQDPVITCSIGFREEKYDELKFSREIADRFKTRHHEYVVEPKALEVLEKLVWHYDEPFADSSAIPTYYVSKLAREHVVVALSGDGGDENFAGYRRYFYDRLENRIRNKIPDTVRRYVVRPLAHAYPKADWAPQIFRAKTLLTNLYYDPGFAYYNSVTPGFKDKDKTKLLKREITESLAGYSSYSVLEGYFRKVQRLDPLSQVQYVDMKTYLVDDILTKVDRASMAVSLEARVPLLDHKLVEFIATIPPSLKLKGKTSKYIFKRTMARLLPEQTLTRRKMGFAVPLERWFRNEIKGLAQDVLFRPNAVVNRYVNTDLVKRVWEQHQNGLRDHSTKLWILLMFELWHAKFGRT